MEIPASLPKKKPRRKRTKPKASDVLLCHTPPHSNPINTSQSWGHSCQGSADIGQGREVHKYWVGEKVLKSLPRILGVRIRGIQVKTFLPPVNSL